MTHTLTRDALYGILNHAQLGDQVVIPAYQGRGMGAYFPGDISRTCFAITGRLETLIRFTIAAGRVLDADHAIDLFASPATDSMGHDQVYYWSNVELETPGLGHILYGDEDDADLDMLDRLDRIGA
jgi:hypothetical protein